MCAVQNAWSALFPVNSRTIEMSAEWQGEQNEIWKCVSAAKNVNMIFLWVCVCIYANSQELYLQLHYDLSGAVMHITTYFK